MKIVVNYCLHDTWIWLLLTFNFIFYITPLIQSFWKDLSSEIPGWLGSESPQQEGHANNVPRLSCTRSS